MESRLLRWTTRIWFVIGVCVLAVGAFQAISAIVHMTKFWWKTDSSSSSIHPRDAGVKIGEKVVTKDGTTLAWQHLNTTLPFKIEGSPWLYIPLKTFRTRTPSRVEETSSSLMVAEYDHLGSGVIGEVYANVIVATKDGEPQRLLIDRPGLLHVTYHHYERLEGASSWPVLDVALLLKDTDSSGTIDASDACSRWFYDLDGTHPICIADSTEFVHGVQLKAPYIFVTKSTSKPASHVSVEDAPSRLWRYDTRTREFTPLPAVNEMVGRANRILLGE